MAKDGFSAADIFNTRVADEYTEEPIAVVEDKAEAEQVDREEIETEPSHKEDSALTPPYEEEEEPFAFGEDEAEEEEKKVDIKAIFSKMPKIKLPVKKVKRTEQVSVEENEDTAVIADTKEISEDYITSSEEAVSEENALLVEEKEPEQEKVAASTEVKEEKKIPETPQSKKKKLIFTSLMVVAATLVFILFGVFLLEQYKMVMPSHDDYGYATLSYVYWEDGMWGQNFSMDQLVHYLTQHYNRWGGRVLSFGQSILLLREGLDFAQGFHAITLGATFLLAFLFAQNGKKTKLLPGAA